MHRAKFCVIALTSFLTVFPGQIQPANSQTKKAVNLKGVWTEQSRTFYWATPGSVGCQSTSSTGVRKVTVTQSKGGNLIIPPFRYWSSPQGKSGAYGSTSVKLSGRVLSFTIKGGGFTAQYKGTISNDGNKITGRVVCSHTSGKAKADVPFTLTRFSTSNQQRKNPPVSGLG